MTSGTPLDPESAARIWESINYQVGLEQLRKAVRSAPKAKKPKPAGPR